MTRSRNRPRGFPGWRWDLLGAARGRTLEIGCGWGFNFTHYPPDAQVMAFDLNPERVRYAARQRAPIPLALADGEQLPWPDHSFDSVVGTLVFCSIPNPAVALAEARRVLRPAGRLLLVEHVRSQQAWLGTLQDWLAPVWKWGTGGCNLNRQTETTVRAAGFEIERLRVGWGGLLKLMIAKTPMV